MRRIILAGGTQLKEQDLTRKGAFNQQAMEAATAIINDVRARGDEALREYTAKFDGVELQELRVSQQAIDEAVAKCDPQVAAALEHAAAQIREFHERQLHQSWFEMRENGALVGTKYTPLDSVGIYVPGGRALYPSSLLMNALPASVAGVKRIVCTTPPTKDGSLDPAILKAAQLCGISEIYTVGGSQAIGALAYGTETIAPVAKVTGPGNAFVAASKKIVSGDCGIDMIAGPSEVCVVADRSADPSLVAIDLMAQAEHDPLATCYLVTFDESYVDEVEACIAQHVAQSPRAEITMASLNDYGTVVVCPNMETALEAVNVIAPEHLELHFDGAMDTLGKIRNAGAIFVGHWTAEAVGDYVAGPNHTLPTGGTARFSSPLSVDDFVKKSSVICYSPEALAYDAEAVSTIAHHEGLWAHARSVELRAEMLKRQE